MALSLLFFSLSLKRGYAILYSFPFSVWFSVKSRLVRPDMECSPPEAVEDTVAAQVNPIDPSYHHHDNSLRQRYLRRQFGRSVRDRHPSHREDVNRGS